MSLLPPPQRTPAQLQQALAGAQNQAAELGFMEYVLGMVQDVIRRGRAFL